MSQTASSPPAIASKLGGYFKESESAWQSLIFLLPWIVVYEVGTWYFTFDPATRTEQRIVAFTMLRDALASLGATARWVAPASVVSVLLGMAICRRERLRVSVGTQAVMLLESILLAGPLLLLGLLVARLPGLANREVLGEGLILSIGAGVYEELIFRLLTFAALHFFLADFLNLPSRVVVPMIVGGSAVAFSLYHYWGPEEFAPQTFVFRTLAGVFFGCVLLCRGFGITAGCHAAYDVLVVLLRGV